MAFSSEVINESYLTDEFLQEVSEVESEYEQLEPSHPLDEVSEYDEQLEESYPLEHHRHQEEAEGHYFRDHEVEDDNDEYAIENNSTHSPLGIAIYDEEHHLRKDDNARLPSSIDEYSLPTMNSQEEGELNQKLCWRLDPSTSLSDWELHIFNRCTKTFEVYNVHRVVLAVGPRRCEFFQDVFRQADAETSPTSASANKNTRVPLLGESCRLVGCFLDYVYGNKQFEITNENALGLCYLADYFRNDSLWELATDFIEEDLGTTTGREHLHQYYIDSLYYDQDEFLDHILTVCSGNLLSMMEDGIPCTKLLGELTPSHFLKVLAEMEPPTEEKLSSSILLTRLITEFCSMHRNELNMNTFDSFMDRVTVLDSSSAIALLEASLEYDFGSYNGNDHKQNNSPRDSVSSLILFQQQCVETLAEEWEELVELDQSRVSRIMRILLLREEHQGILVDWFQKTLKCASSQLMASRQATELAQQQKLVVEDRCSDMAQKLEVAQEETATSQRNHNSTKSEMKTQISSWMRKNEGTNQQRQAEQQQWEHERLRWQMECQQLQHEKSKLKRELKDLRRKYSFRSSATIEEEYSLENTHYSSEQNYDRFRGTSSPSNNRPFVIPNDSGSSDDSRSYVTESSSYANSLVDDSELYSRHDPHAYPLNN